MPDTKAKPRADEAPEMFHGIRYGRPSDSKFSPRIFLLMIAIAAAITLLLDLFIPRRRPPPGPAAPTGPVNVRIVPARPAPDQRLKASSTKTAKKSQPSAATTE